MALTGRQKRLLSVATPALLLVLWEVGVRILRPDPLVLVPPSRIVEVGVELLSDGVLLEASLYSARTFLIAFSAGVVAGVGFGIINGWYKFLYHSLDLVMTAAYTAPIIVLLQLFIVWFGLGQVTTFVIVFISTFFPMAFNATAGVIAVDDQLVRVARSYGEGDLAILRRVAIPSAIPYVLSALRISLGRALTGLVFAEWFAGRGGLGYLVGLYGQTFRTAELFAVIALIIAVSLVLVELMKALEHQYLRKIGAIRAETAKQSERDVVRAVQKEGRIVG